jgi:hypothetical protein
MKDDVCKAESLGSFPQKSLSSFRAIPRSPPPRAHIVLLIFTPLSNDKIVTTLNEYLKQKRGAWLAKREARRKDPDIPAIQLKVSVRALGRSGGVREIRIRDFQMINDSQEDFAGYNFGPASACNTTGRIRELYHAHHTDSGRKAGVTDRLNRRQSDRRATSVQTATRFRTRAGLSAQYTIHP